MGAQKTLYATKLTDVSPSISPEEEPGVLRREVDQTYGERLFRYVVNSSGGALNADSLVSWEDELLGSDVACAAGSSTTKAVRSTGSFITDQVKAGTLIVVIDDAGAAGAAPEGEYSIVTKVEALTVTFAPALSVALAASDTINFIRPYHIIAGAAGHRVGKAAGIPMANIPDDRCGWIQVRGIHPSVNQIAAGTAVAKGASVVAGAGILTAPDGVTADYDTSINLVNIMDDNAGVLGIVLQSLASDTVRRKAVTLLKFE